MTSRRARRLVLTEFGPPGPDDAARVLDQNGTVLATVAEPARRPGPDLLRSAAIGAALRADLGDVILAGVAFAPRWGGDAVGFT